MKQRSKILAGLTAGVMAFSAVCFGFSQWSTDISLNGNVSANGKWDVAITDASVEVSTGAAFTKEAAVASEAYEVVVTYTESTGYYHLALDTAEGIQSNVDLSGLTESGSGRYNAAWTSQNASAYITGDSVGTSNTYYYYFDASLITFSGNGRTPDLGKDSIYADLVGKTVGYAVLKANVSTQIVASDTDDTAWTDISASYAGVQFTLPGAWANYSVTITNNGTVNANLSEYTFDFSELDESVYTIQQPTGFEDEVLAPGESCTFNFVVQVAETDATEFSAESADFAVTLNYVQDTVEEAPEASHTNSSDILKATE